MSKTAFASTGDLEEKKASFDEIAAGVYAYTAEGDPNSGVVVGDEGVLVFDAQATPAMAEGVIARIRQVTDKPVTHVVLSHYHAVRVLGAPAYHAREIVASDAARAMIVERGEQDKASEIGRFPRLFRGAETIEGLTWPSLTFTGAMSIWLGKREVRLLQLGRGHTAGDIVAFIPDCNVIFAGDLVEYGATPYCGDAHFADWPKTLDNLDDFDAAAMVPGRGAALTTRAMVRDGIAGTRAFLVDLYASVQGSVAKGRPLRETFDVAYAALKPAYGDWVIFEHCLPFDVARAYDEAKGIDHPRIWTDVRDREMWAELKG
ncbi:MBL fold metallo-hydrolase [Chelatococcus sp. SYSU_G07232]|uniref:MBL fold metallo-hydrolase n=1 Tax=Chelatococcus albus TaxID=3047466 RepID=A0ABT7ALB0_9HYPH|nr:MBL fold metallo-hydrolase [Chelatococcus sp. SYSU_G07232]MDJ1159850.1 MBL fold metallo-hydrolase [Chelatococcus sp. SYSU_G07232]